MEHQEIHLALPAAESARARWGAARGSDSGEALVQALERLRLVLDRHLGEEEQEVLPLAAEHLSVEEWQELGRHGMSAVSEHWLPVALGLLLQNLPPDARGAFLGSMPPPVAAGWANGGERAFDDYMSSLAERT